MSASELDRLRKAIDELDRVIVKLLNQRAKYAIEVGHAKRAAELPVYSPDREREVLRGVESENRGPLSADGIRRLYERIIDESRRLERQARGQDERQARDAKGTAETENEKGGSE
ncbi:MAG: chorismate mutase [Thermoanaerobaculia bacterium]